MKTTILTVCLSFILIVYLSIANRYKLLSERAQTPSIAFAFIELVLMLSLLLFLRLSHACNRRFTVATYMITMTI